MTTFECFDRAALTELQARNLPRMRAEMILSMDPGADVVECERLMELADKYLEAFVVSEGRKCICCDLKFAGDLFNLLGGFEWGIAHGEGHCRQCGYPARAIHRIPEVGTIRNFVLQYHPSGLSFEARATEEVAR